MISARPIKRFFISDFSGRPLKRASFFGVGALVVSYIFDKAVFCVHCFLAYTLIVENNKEKKGKFGIAFQTSYRFNKGKVIRLRVLQSVRGRNLILG
jgi:hypothetical protein